MLYAYEAFDWWGDPRATALLIVAYFAAAIVVDALFHRAAFCKVLPVRRAAEVEYAGNRCQGKEDFVNCYWRII